MDDPSATCLEEADPDQILNDWALTAADLEGIRHARRSDNRLWTALHLCCLRRTGRFLDDPTQAPQSVIIHLSRRLGDEPPARLLPLRGSTLKPSEFIITSKISTICGIRWAPSSFSPSRTH